MSYLSVETIKRRLFVDFVNDRRRPQEQDVVDFSLDVDANFQLRRVVGDDLPLLRHLLADLWPMLQLIFVVTDGGEK